MAPHSSTLAWKIPWTEEPGGLQSMGSLRVGHDWVTSLSLFTFMHWRRKWQPTPMFLPGESQGQRSLVGCRLWGHIESDTTEAMQQQPQQQQPVVPAPFVRDRFIPIDWSWCSCQKQLTIDVRVYLWTSNSVLKNWLTGKDPDAGKDGRQGEKGTTEDEMVGWHHQLDGHEFEQALGVDDGQESLTCCSPWACKESDMAEQLNWTEFYFIDLYIYPGEDMVRNREVWCASVHVIAKSCTQLSD